MSNLPRGILLRASNNASGADAAAPGQWPEVSIPGRSEAVRYYARESGLDSLPNDLTRLLYLASLRDCNSGCYLHPQLSGRIGTEAVDQALRACHEDVFCRLLTTPTSGYVQQLEEYIRYIRTERTAVLKTWQSLQAYRATVPVRALPIHCELFCLNIELALMILRPQAPPSTTDSQDAISRCV